MRKLYVRNSKSTCQSVTRCGRALSGSWRKYAAAWDVTEFVMCLTRGTCIYYSFEITVTNCQTILFVEKKKTEAFPKWHTQEFANIANLLFTCSIPSATIDICKISCKNMSFSITGVTCPESAINISGGYIHMEISFVTLRIRQMCSCAVACARGEASC